MSTQAETATTDVQPSAVAGFDLQVPSGLSSTLQYVEDSYGTDSSLALTAYPGPVIVTTSLGIAQTPPSYALHVGPNQTARFELGTSGSVSLGGVGALSVDAPNIPSGRFVVATGGNVGINQPNPQYTLDVTGNIRVTGIPENTAAPSNANLQAVYVDVNTGVLYWD
jgi:hypothetical protein